MNYIAVGHGQDHQIKLTYSEFRKLVGWKRIVETGNIAIYIYVFIQAVLEGIYRHNIFIP